MRTITLLLLMALVGSLPAQAQKRKGHMKDSVALGGVTVVGKSKTQRLREGAFTVNAIDVRRMVNSVQSLSSIIDHTAGVKVREQGGVGSDFDLSINGMSGNSVRYFIDGIPLDTKGSGVTLSNLPLNLVDHVEIYKGVVPTWLSSDALGGAVNIVTRSATGQQKNYLDASYGVGSFHTHKADFNAQLVLKNGLFIRPTVSYNYSKNDYMMRDVELWDEAERKYLPQDRRRFHDGYNAILAQVEVGVSHTSWADNFFLTASYNHTHKDIQTGQMQNKVVGMADRSGNATSLAATYQKRHFLSDRFDVKAYLSHTWDNALTTDTAYRKYDWNGDYILTSRNEITGRARTRRHFKRPLTIVRADLSYHLAAEHLLSLSYALSRTGNNRWDEVDKTFEPSNDALAKHIVGLNYTQSLLDERLHNTFFLKDYINHLSIEQTDIPSVTNSRDVMGSSTKNHFGYGVGSRLVLSEPLALKASFEHSVRLPLARELLGNGTTIYANVALEPEQSNNVNLGLFGTLRWGDHTLSYEANGFLRFVDKYIQPQISEKEGMMQYVNVPAVHIKGLEAEVRYDYQQRLQLMGNVSWQDARDRQRYKSDGKPSVTFNNHVPNRPWFFATAEAQYTLPDLFQNGDRLRLGAAYQWVHWFFLSWEGYGALDTKARIPTKHEVDASLTYSWHRDRYNLSLECQNVLNATIYDNYKLQKPGRALFAKFRLFIN